MRVCQFTGTCENSGLPSLFPDEIGLYYIWRWHSDYSKMGSLCSLLQPDIITLSIFSIQGVEEKEYKRGKKLGAEQKKSTCCLILSIYPKYSSETRIRTHNRSHL
jgi:hypothetical protein